MSTPCNTVRFIRYIITMHILYRQANPEQVFTIILILYNGQFFVKSIVLLFDDIL